MNTYKKYLTTMGIVWGISLVVFAIASYFIINPQMKIKSKLFKEVAEKKAQLDLAYNASLEENKKKLAAEVETLRTKLGDYVSDYENFANQTFSISRIAGDKQVTAFTVKTPEMDKQQDQIKAKSLQENKMEISFTSDFLQFANFINTLERHQPVVFVDRFKIQRGDQGGPSNKVDMSLSFFVRKKQTS
jgi:hypothetical protein